MIDVHAKANGKNGHRGRHQINAVAERGIGPYPFTRSAAATTFFARNWEMIEVRCLRL
jgi:hypothetical protein